MLISKVRASRLGVRISAKLARYWPAHLKNPFGLLWRIVRSGDRTALFALWTFVLTLLAIPLDLVFYQYEKKRLKQVAARKHPIIFICGPARSGTTITHQLLVGSLPVSYFSNLITIFPQSPLTAYSLFRRWLRRPAVGTESFYGKTQSLSGPNDADPVWNRWVELDSASNRTKLTADSADQMAEFFRAFEISEGRPIVCKNNKLLAFASVVNEHVENAWFICLTREPSYLAQSLLIAARTLQGDASAGYGLADTSDNRDGEVDLKKDPIAVAVERVHYNQRLIQDQQNRIGRDRFWIVNYEDVCENPTDLVNRVATEILQTDLDQQQLKANVPKLRNGNSVKLAQDEFDQIRACFEPEKPSTSTG